MSVRTAIARWLKSGSAPVVPAPEPIPPALESTISAALLKAGAPRSVVDKGIRESEDEAREIAFGLAKLSRDDQEYWKQVDRAGMEFVRVIKSNNRISPQAMFTVYFTVSRALRAVLGALDVIKPEIPNPPQPPPGRERKSNLLS